MAGGIAEEIERAGSKAWASLKFQFPDAWYRTDGDWFRGGLSPGADESMCGTLLALVTELRSRQGG